MSDTYDDFIDNLDGTMDPQQAAQLLDMATGDGDTVEITESDDAPNVTDLPEDTAPASADENNEVLLARDGVHTIPFSVLTETRDLANLRQEQLDAANAEIERLKALSQSQPSEIINDDTVSNDVEYDDSIFGDYDEAGIANGIRELIARERQQQNQQLIEQQRAQAQAAAEQAHWEAISSAHSDIDSIVASSEFASWADSQSSFVQAGISRVLEQGTATEVIDLISSYKDSTMPASKPNGDDDMMARAQAAIKQAKAAVPVSLSDMNGQQSPTSIAERLNQMPAHMQVEEMSNWSQEEIDQYLNRNF